MQQAVRSKMQSIYIWNLKIQHKLASKCPFHSIKALCTRLTWASKHSKNANFELDKCSQSSLTPPIVQVYFGCSCWKFHKLAGVSMLSSPKVWQHWLVPLVWNYSKFVWTWLKWLPNTFEHFHLKILFCKELRILHLKKYHPNSVCLQLFKQLCRWLGMIKDLNSQKHSSGNAEGPKA